MPTVRDTENNSWLETISDAAGSVAKSTPAQQMAIGGVSGWCAGYSFCKIGKWVAFGVGAGVLIFTVAQSKGWVQVTVKKNRLEEEMSKMKDTLKDLKNELNPYHKTTTDKIVDFCKENFYLAGGFTGGFFLGVGSA